MVATTLVAQIVSANDESVSVAKDLTISEQVLGSEKIQNKVSDFEQDSKEKKQVAETLIHTSRDVVTHADNLSQKQSSLSKLKEDEATLAKDLSELTAQVEAKKAELEKEKASAPVATATTSSGSSVSQANGTPYFGSDGLLVMQASDRAQQVVNGLHAIPGHANGAAYHQNGLDDLINTLSVEEAVWVVWRIEGAGFGQTGDGYAGLDTPASHQTFWNNQVNNRFGGSVHALLRAWGTFSYGGY